MDMPTTISNQTSVVYQVSGSSDVFKVDSNNRDVILEDSQGLNVIKTANSSSFVPGQIVTYTITITNTSSQFLNGVRVIDNLGGGNLAYVLGSANLAVGSISYPVSPVATNPLTFTLQELNVGESMTLVYSCQVIFNLPSSVQNITNSVQAIGYTSTGTISGFATNTVTRTVGTDLTVVKSSTRTNVLPNQVFDYVITLTNNTSNEVLLNTLTDQLPSNFVVTNISRRIGTGNNIVLQPSEYTLSGSNLLTIPSSTGLSVPANGSTVLNVTGYFQN